MENNPNHSQSRKKELPPEIERIRIEREAMDRLRSESRSLVGFDPDDDLLEVGSVTREYNNRIRERFYLLLETLRGEGVILPEIVKLSDFQILRGESGRRLGDPIASGNEDAKAIFDLLSGYILLPIISPAEYFLPQANIRYRYQPDTRIIELADGNREQRVVGPDEIAADPKNPGSDYFAGYQAVLQSRESAPKLPMRIDISESSIFPGRRDSSSASLMVTEVLTVLTAIRCNLRNESLISIADDAKAEIENILTAKEAERQNVIADFAERLRSRAGNFITAIEKAGIRAPNRIESQSWHRSENKILAFVLFRKNLEIHRAEIEKRRILGLKTVERPNPSTYRKATDFEYVEHISGIIDSVIPQRHRI